MVVDTSALVAVLIGEPNAEKLQDAINGSRRRYIAIASVLEASIVLENRYGEDGARELDLILARLPVEVVPMDLDQLEWARQAYRAYGRGRHKAGLNFGDCFAYALAKLLGEPLLYIGNDFRKTDIPSALATK